MIGATKRLKVSGISVFATVKPRRRWFRTGILIGILLVVILAFA